MCFFCGKEEKDEGRQKFLVCEEVKSNLRPLCALKYSVASKHAVYLVLSVNWALPLCALILEHF